MFILLLWGPLQLKPQALKGLLLEAVELKAQCFLLSDPLMSQLEAGSPFLPAPPLTLTLPPTPHLLHPNQIPYLNSNPISPTNFALSFRSLC